MQCCKGHVPIIGVNLALPVIESAGQESYQSIMSALSLSLTERCDAILRIGGASTGADEEVATFRRAVSRLSIARRDSRLADPA